METIKKEIKIELISKLHIGKGSDGLLEGGEYTQTCKRLAKEGYPEVYIPASSLKGKLRSLLSNSDRFEKDNKYTENVLKLFGMSANKNKNGITRLLFRDAILPENASLDNTEIKYENTINDYNNFIKDKNKDKSKSQKTNLRSIEYIVEGTIFEADLIIRLMEDDNLKDFEEILNYGFELLKMDYLGGNGSRGYGAIDINFKEEI